MNLPPPLTASLDDMNMPDVTDTGIVIGTMNPTSSLSIPPPPHHHHHEVAAEDDDAMILTAEENSMDGVIIRKNSSATAEDNPSGVIAAAAVIVAVDEEEALRTINKLRGDDLPLRIEAAKRLQLVAAAIGPERTRNELLPFLADAVDDDDDVLEAIADSIGQLVSYVGPKQEHLLALLHPLELLLAVEESVVRDRAADSAIVVSNMLTETTYQTEFVPMITRLATKEWFTARLSACKLIPIAFPRMSSLPGGGQQQQSQSQQLAHVTHFATLCRDEAPMVRRIASRNLGPMLETVINTLGPSCLKEDTGIVTTILLDLYDSLAGGDQPDSVRLHTTQNCVHLGQAITHMKEKKLLQQPQKNDEGNAALMVEADDGEDMDDLEGRLNTIVKRILPLIVATIDDRSWRVRWTAASKFALVVHAFTKLDGTMDALVPAYEKLLQDPEAEVRTAATFNFSEVAKSTALVYPVGYNSITSDMSSTDSSSSSRRISVALRLVKRIVQLTEDDSENVRAALAMVVTDLAPILGRNDTITHLLPPMLILLRDSTSEVRLNIISSLSLLTETIGPELLTQSLLPAILDLADDSKWRIRLAVIERIPLLAKQLGKEVFTDELLTLCVGWLGDDISSIREATATSLLKELTSLLGSDWCVKNILPRVKGVMDHPSYLRRMNAVRSLSFIAMTMDAYTAQWEVLPMLLDMSIDPVANVRFNVAKGLGMIGVLFSQSLYKGQIVPILTHMMDDPDRDVRHFATMASNSLSAFFDKSQTQQG
jgi:serine/threonine-protein phosphatase 2A regulatory subunit A